MPPQPDIPHPLRVIIADDHAGYAEMLSEILQSDPRIAVVGRAANGLEAIELALRLRPDAVVMDVNMPLLDGFRATEHIRDELPFASVVVVSGTPRNDHVRRARNAGAVVYLPKDAGPDEIRGALLQTAHDRLQLAG